MVPDLTGLVRTLNQAGVRYVVIGGIAVAAHGYVRATEDLDIVPEPSPENLDELGNTLIRIGARLAANPERVLTRAQLRDKVWGYPHDLDDHSVDPHVQRLRRKLSERSNIGVSLEAVPGLGYRLSVKGA